MTEKFGINYFYGKKESNYSNYEKIDATKQFKRAISFIKKEGIGGRLLDVGCAFGLFLKEISPFFREIYGCDISSFAIDKAKLLVPRAELEIFDVQKPLPYPDDFFDCITAFDVLEHTVNAEKVFGNLVKKLKKGGYFIVSIPINTLWRKIFHYLDRDKTHISILSEKELTKMISQNQLKVIGRTYFLPVPVIYRIPHIKINIELFLRK